SPLLHFTQLPKSKFTKLNVISPSVSTQPAVPLEETTQTDSCDQDDKFDWFSYWYPLMPVCDLDKRVPTGKKVLGLDVVVWWDRNDNEWKVFEDRCPHRLAPLSEGRIDQWGRLQCVYHGWCFGGSGDCKLIPQAPVDGPSVHSSPKACVGVYPSTVQNEIVWFWPNNNPKHKDVITKKKPPYIPELDDPSFSFHMFNRDIPYGYEVLIENVMDPSHVDREGGSPIDIKIHKIDKNGFTTTEQPDRKWNFVSPCLVQGTLTIKESLDSTKGNFSQTIPRKDLFIFLCVPVSQGNSRLISVFPRNFRIWIDPFVTRWMHHVMQNLVIDSDFYLLRVQEEKLMETSPSNWEKTCFVPTKADGNVVAYRKWLKQYAGGKIDWGTKSIAAVTPMPTREQLLDRYWTHVVNCNSCKGAYKGFKALEIFLQQKSYRKM
ncbi:hypothetical protein M8C21_010658, partial [Ambrosia artemisiifolia]